MSADDSFSSSSDDATVTRFFGFNLAANAEETFMLTSTELHITGVALNFLPGGEAGKTLVDRSADIVVVVTASTPDMDAPIVLATLSVATPQVLLDVDFTDVDEEVVVKATVVSGKAAAGKMLPGVSLTGTMTIPMASLLEADEDEEDEEGEEATAEAEEEEEEEEEAVAPAPAPAPAAKRQRVEAAAAAPAPAAGAGKAKTAPSPAKPAVDDKMTEITSGLSYKDSVVGIGAQASKGQRVTVKYAGRLVNGKQFDAGERFSFRLGAGEVIKGWDLGVAGMRVGTRRQLVIHPKFAYGARGAPPSIPANATLIFDVELIKVQ